MKYDGLRHNKPVRISGCIARGDAEEAKIEIDNAALQDDLAAFATNPLHSQLLSMIGISRREWESEPIRYWCARGPRHS
jgi:hypothetical protein